MSGKVRDKEGWGGIQKDHHANSTTLLHAFFYFSFIVIIITHSRMDGEGQTPNARRHLLHNQTTTTQDTTGEGRTLAQTDPHWIILITPSWFGGFLGAWRMEQELHRHKTQCHCRQTGWCFDGILKPLTFFHLSHHQDNHQLALNEEGHSWITFKQIWCMSWQRHFDSLRL